MGEKWNERASPEIQAPIKNPLHHESCTSNPVLQRCKSTRRKIRRYVNESQVVHVQAEQRDWQALQSTEAKRWLQEFHWYEWVTSLILAVLHDAPLPREVACSRLWTNAISKKAMFCLKWNLRCFFIFLVERRERYSNKVRHLQKASRCLHMLHRSMYRLGCTCKGDYATCFCDVVQNEMHLGFILTKFTALCTAAR